MTRINQYAPHEESKFNSVVISALTTAVMLLAGLLSLASFAA